MTKLIRILHDCHILCITSHAPKLGAHILSTPSWKSNNNNDELQLRKLNCSCATETPVRNTARENSLFLNYSLLSGHLSNKRQSKRTKIIFIEQQRKLNTSSEFTKKESQRIKNREKDFKSPPRTKSSTERPVIRDRSNADDIEELLLQSSGRVVWGAVIVNSANFVAKTFAWWFTGSHSMFAEAVHSLADTANQLILAIGIRKSLQSPTPDHPYGYHQMRYIAPLISGVGIFCVGCGLSMYHGLEALIKPASQAAEAVSPTWAYAILAFSLVSESATLTMALKAVRRGAVQSKLSVREFVKRNRDPGVIVVLLEDVAAVMGIGIAATCVTLSSHYGSQTYDAVGSLLVGSLLGFVASYIIKKNTVALVGRSIQRDTLKAINRLIEKDVMIRAIHDVKATDLGNGVIRYKAEVDVDGRELARKYLERLQLSDLLQEIQTVQTEAQAEAFILKHGENVVDLLGAEIDRIEKELRRTHPRVKHVDLEVL